MQVQFGGEQLSGPEVNCNNGAPSRSEKDSTIVCGEGDKDDAQVTQSSLRVGIGQKYERPQRTPPPPLADGTNRSQLHHTDDNALLLSVRGDQHKLLSPYGGYGGGTETRFHPDGII